MNTSNKIEAGALFTEDRSHRLVLWRIWDIEKPKVMFVGLNPSIADETRPDPTISRICDIAAHNGFGGIYMLNLFTQVTAYPKELRLYNTIDNMVADERLKEYAAKSGMVILAWGAFKKAKGRGDKVARMFPDAHCLKHTKDGDPWHPLYMKKTTVPIKFK